MVKESNFLVKLFVQTLMLRFKNPILKFIILKQMNITVLHSTLDATHIK